MALAALGKPVEENKLAVHQSSESPEWTTPPLDPERPDLERSAVAVALNVRNTPP
jgi:hypothetical protein